MNGFDEKLRDDFAGRAMAAMIMPGAVKSEYTPMAMELVAEVAYMMADAMMAERAKREVK